MICFRSLAHISRRNLGTHARALLSSGMLAAFALAHLDFSRGLNMQFGSYLLGFDKEVFTEDLKIGVNQRETYANLDLCSNRENKLQFSEPLKKEKFFKSYRTEHCFQNPTGLQDGTLVMISCSKGFLFSTTPTLTPALDLPSYVCNSGGSRHASAQTTSSSSPSRTQSESSYVGSLGRWAKGYWDSG